MPLLSSAITVSVLAVHEGLQFGSQAVIQLIRALHNRLHRAAHHLIALAGHCGAPRQLTGRMRIAHALIMSTYAPAVTCITLVR